MFSNLPLRKWFSKVVELVVGVEWGEGWGEGI